MSKDNTLWLMLVAAGGIGAVYVWHKSHATTAPAGSSPFVPSLPAAGGQTLPSGQVLAPVPSQQLPVATVSNMSPGMIDPNVWSVVQSWAQEDGRAPVLNMASAQVPSEYAGMYDIISNFWDKNVKIQPGSAQETFWNNLREKYDPGPPPDQIW